MCFIFLTLLTVICNCKKIKYKIKGGDAMKDVYYDFKSKGGENNFKRSKRYDS